MSGLNTMTAKQNIHKREQVGYSMVKPRRRQQRYDDGTFKSIDKDKQKAGRKGGLTTGESKARFGATNGKYDATRERRPCCGVIATRSHKKTCPNHRLYKLNAIKNLRKESIIKVKINTDNYVKVSGVSMWLRGVDSNCTNCNENQKAISATWVHQDDLQKNPVRVICKKCSC
jgi:hypothetical protein